MEGKTILYESSDEVLVDLFDKKLEKRLQAFKNELLAKDANDELMTREQACEFLQIDPSTLWAWQNRGKVTAYGISGNRRFYKRSQLFQALTPLKK